MDNDALAAALGAAEKQYSFITWDQALSAGLTPVALRRLVAQGHWQQLGHGLYRVNGAKETWRGRLKGICLRAGERSVISHRAAAALCGIEGFEPWGPGPQQRFRHRRWLQLWVTYRRKQERPERVVADVRDALACRGGP